MEEAVPQHVAAPQRVEDNFNRSPLHKRWQWSVFQQPKAVVKNGELHLPAANSASGNFLGRQTTSAHYTTTVKVHGQKSSAAAGVGAIGDEKNTISVLYEKGVVRVIQVRDGTVTELAKKTFAKTAKPYLRMQVRKGKEIRFFYSKNGRSFTELTMNAIDGSYLPPWDRAIRSGIIARGEEGKTAVFDHYEMVNDKQ